MNPPLFGNMLKTRSKSNQGAGPKFQTLKELMSNY